MGNCVQAGDKDDESKQRGGTAPIRRPLSTAATPPSASSTSDRCVRCPPPAAHWSEPLTGGEPPSVPPTGAKQLSGQSGGVSATASVSASQSVLLTPPPPGWLIRQWSASGSAILSAPLVDLAELRLKGHKCHGQHGSTAAQWALS
jgi:hypothetical protein